MKKTAIEIPGRGDWIVTTADHPKLSADLLIGVVLSVQGGIVNVTLSNGDTDRIYWRSADGVYNPFYTVKKD